MSLTKPFHATFRNAKLSLRNVAYATFTRNVAYATFTRNLYTQPLHATLLTQPLVPAKQFSSCEMKKGKLQMKRVPNFFHKKGGSAHRNCGQQNDCGCWADLALKTRSSPNWSGTREFLFPSSWRRPLGLFEDRSTYTSVLYLCRQHGLNRARF